MGKFVIKPTKNNGVKFDLIATTGKVIASSQVYANERNCRSGIESVIANAPGAALEDQTVKDFAEQKHPKFEVYVDKAGEYRFRLKATNGQIVAVSEGFADVADCLSTVDSVRQNVAGAPVEVTG